MAELRLDFPGVQTRLNDSEIAQIVEAIKSAKTYSMGPELKKFEDEFSTYHHSQHCFGLNNATSALELSAILSGVMPGDEVLLPAHTFAASALPFLRRKAKLVFVDIEPNTFLMDINDLKKKITSRSRAIVGVHLYGLPVDLDPLIELAQSHGLFVVEDCAQSPGATYKGKKVGTFGDVACFSFHGQKNITTLGEGGMLVTKHDKFVEPILGFRKIGARPFKNQEQYWIPAMSNIVESIPGELPYNFALGEIAALAGRLLFARLDQINESRRKQYNQITSALANFPELTFQQIPEGRTSAHHLLPAKFQSTVAGKSRNDLIALLFQKYGIKSVVQYYPLYNYELFNRHGYCKENASCPQTDHFFDNMISFPFASHMSSDQLGYLVNSVASALTELRK